ncbi:MAG: hypothetical protein QME52_08580 [Bacteroidota bacterium]|nr:hypothetical protein [Bacteroidota bacterium]
MVEKEFLVHIAEKFNQLQIPYMITGSMAVSFYGCPRTTHDVDLVLAIQVGDIEKIIKMFSNKFYISDVEHAIKHKQMFNLIHQESQYKIDCWILDNGDEYRAEAFQRRIKTKILGTSISFISKEDLIVSKLLWYKEAQTDIHLQDVRSVISIQMENLDIEYINTWSEHVSVSDFWLKIKQEINL